MYGLKKKLERYLRVNLLGPGPRLMKKNLPGRGLTKVERNTDRGNIMHYEAYYADYLAKVDTAIPT